MTVQRRRCGNTSLELPALGVGCWSFGGGEYWGSQDHRDVDAVVRGAIDAGCDYFDTAEAYNEGASEASLGAALKGRRDRAIIGTKVSPSNCHPAALRQHCHASLKRLQTDHIDLYMVHWPIHPHSVRHFTSDERVIANPPAVDEAFEALDRLRQEGKIRHVGVSNFGRARLAEAMRLSTIAANELPYGLLTRAIELEALPHCRDAGVGVIGYLALLQGLLADKHPTLQDMPAWRRRTRHFHHAGCPLCRHGEQGAEKETTEALAAIRAIAGRAGMTMSEIALKWALGGEGITCSLVGIRNAVQLDKNVRAASQPLGAELAAELNAATLPLLRKLGNSFDYYESTENDRTK